ncbi:hypothetical protein MNBD_NITROSPINAE02-1954 [hydrothermal vent metagenome]|uniref:Cds6 C-terminal domain-containing protein n=1 Tax=hydrothermal vent metagenome TaxID=652676 RepID=A0A3B1CVK6_9ZZZZ
MRTKIFFRLFSTRFVSGFLFPAIFAVISGCAQAPAQPDNKGVQPLAQEPPPVIKEIHSKTLNNKTIVTIRASAPFEFIAYKLRNPIRLAVELASAKSSLPGPAVMVGDKLVGMISILKFKQSQAVRMEIELKRDCEFETKMNGSSLDVILTPMDNSELKLAHKELKQERRKALELGVETERLKRRIAFLEKEKRKTEGIASRPKRESAQEDEKPDDEAAYARAPAGNVEPGESDEGLIKELLMGWYAAWKARDISDYSSYYSDTFSYKGGGKKEWIKSKQKKFKKSGVIEVIIREINISISGRDAVISFTQHYKSANYKDVGTKTLTMKKTGDGWKIESESWRAIK